MKLVWHFLIRISLFSNHFDVPKKKRNHNEVKWRDQKSVRASLLKDFHNMPVRWSITVAVQITTSDEHVTWSDFIIISKGSTDNVKGLTVNEIVFKEFNWKKLISEVRICCWILSQNSCCYCFGLFFFLRCFRVSNFVLKWIGQKVVHVSRGFQSKYILANEIIYTAIELQEATDRLLIF